MHRLRTEPGFLGATLRARAAATDSHTLLFVDQFEELYTLVPDPAERRAFTASLAAVADDTASPLRVVVSMRSDFLDRVGEDPRFMEELSRGLVFLTAPDRDGLREALEQPVEMVGYRFESAAMVDDMLDALAHTPGALPLLQFAAAKLWDARDRDRRLLTMASYQAIGGISGALATHADEVVGTMSASAQRLTQKVFRQLVTPERTRAIVELADLHQLSPDPDEITRVIDLLVDARLLVVQTRGDAGGGSVEIVHESLIERWPMLRRWLDEDQEDAAFLAQLAAAAKQWDARATPGGPAVARRGDGGGAALVRPAPPDAHAPRSGVPRRRARARPARTPRPPGRADRRVRDPRRGRGGHQHRAGAHAHPEARREQRRGPRRGQGGGGPAEPRPGAARAAGARACRDRRQARRRRSARGATDRPPDRGGARAQPDRARDQEPRAA